MEFNLHNNLVSPGFALKTDKKTHFMMNELYDIDIMKHWSDGIHEFCLFYLLSFPLLPQAQEAFSGASKTTRAHQIHIGREPEHAHYGLKTFIFSSAP